MTLNQIKIIRLNQGKPISIMPTIINNSLCLFFKLLKEQITSKVFECKWVAYNICSTYINELHT